MFKEVIARNLEQECVDDWALSHIVPLSEIQAYLIFQRDNKNKSSIRAAENTAGAKPNKTTSDTLPASRKKKAVPSD